MVLKKIHDRWWMLTSDDGFLKLTWFGNSKEEVMGRFNAYVRSVDMSKIKCQYKWGYPHELRGV
jgi:hypothetical protein